MALVYKAEIKGMMFVKDMNEEYTPWMIFTEEALDNLDKMLLSKDMSDKNLAIDTITKYSKDYINACKDYSGKNYIGQVVVYYTQYKSNKQNGN